MRKLIGLSVGAFVLSFGVAGPRARADVFQDIGLALGYAGFNIQGDHNYLSGGADFLMNTNFLGNQLDFGAGDLTLQGPISLEFQSGGRLLSEAELHFTTALSSQLDATPLRYQLNYDAGGQKTTIDGSLLVDGSMTFNGFGFYDLQMTYSSRQTVSRDGTIVNDQRTSDFDVGPINISGNIFADALSLLTQPLFDASGQENPFASLSGASQLADLLATSATRQEAARAIGDVDQLAGAAPPLGSAVPEPATLVLLALGAICVGRGVRARR